ncbi:MAG: anthranilate phosphoribosyltransferase [Pseudolactococcus laudensis]|uniref:Anthranilate phosphoribosyltransferase n=1 Tax=Pseudolactococcus laudensis TaxID=1494461 RepID=A0A7V8MZU8_9LACT|nr:anthranilate phosphoribosyltransferase [Lactococcus laudensis]MBA0016114.1 anthranilate phosphoribosyltransferase [Lactococcus laudensis]MBW9280439.1 anthranilate phosphoribosyltransferase [Lactococcus laudensis]
MKENLVKLMNRENLSRYEVNQMANAMFNGELTDSQLSAILIALAMKGETVDEMAGIVDVVRDKALHIPTTVTTAMDNCGTGGDLSFSFNVSTTSAFVLAAGGVKMAKHGNRSISSKSGSADVLEALGINLYHTPDELAEIFDQTGLVFLFAQHVHPNMRYVMPVRRELEVRTVLNLIGPFTNPVDLDTQLLGTSRPDLLTTTAEVLKSLGRRRAVVVSGPNNMDEASLDGVNRYALLDETGEITVHEFDHESLGMPRVTLQEIRGGEGKENAVILKSVLNNEPSPFLEVTVLNAGLGFFANGCVESVAEGVAKARDVIASGAAMAKLVEMRELK